MSDFLKTPVANIASTKWSAGEQPTAGKFRFLFNSYYSALNAVCKILGPLENDNQAISTPGNILSSYNYGRMSLEEKNNLVLNAESSILNTFNLARIIGPHASLNPTYLPGSVHLVASQGNGWLLQESKTQQLPFPPHTESASAYEYDEETELYTCNYNVEIWDTGVEATDWLPVGTPEECLSSVDKVWHLAEDGTLYSSRAFGATEYIKYDLYVPNSFGVLGSGYNAIPDLSIFSLTEEDRQTLYNTDDEYGAIILSYVTTSGSRSKWKVKLPKIISSKDSLTSLNDRGVSATLGAGSFEPFGEFITDGKYYVLNSDIYIAEDGDQPNTLTENVLALYDTSSGQTYSLGLSWDKTSDKRELYFYGPLFLKNRLFANDGVTLLSSDIALTNSKNFVLFCLGTNLSDTVSQNTLNYARHRHNGADSYKISHRDLLDAEGNVQAFSSSQDGTGGGLDFINYDRQLAFSEVQDNPHTQYFNRLGYRFGGSQGFYSNFPSNKAVDLNAMHGDLLFYPIYNTPKAYGWSSESNYDENVALGNTVEEITWDLTNLLTQKTDNFVNIRSHAMIFGFPSQASSKRYLQGATKLYYEPMNFIVSSGWDNTGNPWRLWRHGFIPGNNTGTANARGLNIGWGNLFFGYREDILNGRLTQSETKTEASAFWRTSEFNVVTTGNEQAGNNTNSEIKDGYAYRDGFNVRALKGSNIWLSAGNSDITVGTGKNVDSNPGTIAIESSFLPYTTSTLAGLNTLVTLDEFNEQASSGAGIFTSPGTKLGGNVEGITHSVPWASKIPNNYKFAQLWDNDVFAVTTANLSQAPLSLSYGHGPLLDIVNLAPDINKRNINPDLVGVASSTYNGNVAGDLDDNLGKWPFGKPLVRGTYGIDFCVSGQLDNLDIDFKTGFQLEDQEYGPDRALIWSGENALIHREFRFWGKNSKIMPSASMPSDADTQGGNINLLYGLGKDYTRFGKLRYYQSSSYGGGGSDYSPWFNARAISLGSSKPVNYGSAIRNASYVDAFQGVRHDPLQPYTATYVYPFRAIIDLGLFAGDYFSGVDTDNGNLTYSSTDNDITKAICEKNILILSPETPMESFYHSEIIKQAIIQNANNFNSQSGLPSIDALIKGNEEIFLENSNTSHSNCTLRSLLDFKINLDYFTGKQVVNLDKDEWAAASSNYADVNSPHSTYAGLSGYGNYRSFGRVLFGYNVMVPASGYNLTGAGDATPWDGVSNDYVEGTEGLNRIPVVLSGRQPQPYLFTTVGGSDNDINTNIKALNNPNAIIGYQDFLGSVKGNTSAMSSYNNRFPLYKTTYGSKQNLQSGFLYDVTSNSNNNIFVPIVNIPDFYKARHNSEEYPNHNFNFSVPYRVFVGKDRGSYTPGSGGRLENQHGIQPAFRDQSTGQWRYYNYADGLLDDNAGVSWDPANPLVDLQTLGVYVELRGKIVIKVITAPVKNVIVD